MMKALHVLRVMTHVYEGIYQIVTSIGSCTSLLRWKAQVVHLLAGQTCP
jgi:hypothetical protein